MSKTAATSTFFLGLAAVRLVGAVAALETRLADLLVPDSGIAAVAPAPLVGREEREAAEVYAAVLREAIEGGVEGRRVVVLSETVGDCEVCDGEGIVTRARAEEWLDP